MNDLGTLIIIITLAGCAAPLEYQRPEAPVPANWTNPNQLQDKAIILP